ncbi:HYC_CC_PP family protein [Niastella vici]
MKKLIVIFLLTLYASNSVGLSINFHFCCGHLAKISLSNLSHIKGCGCDHNDKPKKCCKNVLAFYQSDNHRITQFAQIAELIYFPVERPIENYQVIFFCPDSYNTHFKVVNVPERGAHPIFLLCNVFRI